eukprot:c7523_g1_i1.p1 GENE.c7523_g1_i1~~c7523_g1_i1.p1  ORF type:complete len:343 (-),score=65.99 c7523_g1_i1:156-1184(-)
MGQNIQLDEEGNTVTFVFLVLFPLFWVSWHQSGEQSSRHCLCGRDCITRWISACQLQQQPSFLSSGVRRTWLVHSHKFNTMFALGDLLLSQDDDCDDKSDPSALQPGAVISSPQLQGTNETYQPQQQRNFSNTSVVGHRLLYPRVSLYIMSKCPSAAKTAAHLLQALQSLSLALAHTQHPLQIDFHIGYIGHVFRNKTDSTTVQLSSMHGKSEVFGDLWEVCAFHQLRTQPLAWLQFLTCVNREQASIPSEKSFRHCASGIPTLNFATLQVCVVSEEGANALVASFNNASSQNIHRSPTLAINSAVLGERSEHSIVEALCRALSPPSAVATPLCHRAAFMAS